MKVADNSDNEKEVYCNECGEDKDIAFVETYASGDYWKCRVCKHEFHM